MASREVVVGLSNRGDDWASLGMKGDCGWGAMQAMDSLMFEYEPTSGLRTLV